MGTIWHWYFCIRPNKQLTKYVAWKPDPNAEFIDAFLINLNRFYFYAFPGGGDGSPSLAYPDVVHESVGTSGRCSPCISERTGLAVTTPFREEAFLENDIDGISSVWCKFQEQGIREGMADYQRIMERIH